MLPYLIDKPEHVAAICKDIIELEGYVRALDCLTVHYDSSAREMLHANKALHTVLSLVMRRFDWHAIDAIVPQLFDLLATCVDQLSRADWTELVAEMQRSRDSLSNAGVVHPPLSWPTGQHVDGEANLVALRMSHACCHAELLLLLLRAGLCLSPDCSLDHSLLNQLMQGRWRQFDVATIWPPLLSAMHALLVGCQPHFKTWPNAVDMMQDAHQVRVPIPLPAMCTSCRRQVLYPDIVLWHARQLCRHVTMFMESGTNLDSGNVRSFLTALARRRTFTLLVAHQANMSEEGIQSVIHTVCCERSVSFLPGSASRCLQAYRPGRCFLPHLCMHVDRPWHAC